VKNEQLPATVYVIGFVSLALLIINLVLVANQTATPPTNALGIVGAIGTFLCPWIIKRHQAQ
jgi:hypothetical protein